MLFGYRRLDRRSKLWVYLPDFFNDISVSIYQVKDSVGLIG